MHAAFTNLSPWGSVVVVGEGTPGLLQLAEAGVEGVGSPGDSSEPAFAPSPVGGCSHLITCSLAGSIVGVAPCGEYTVALEPGPMSAVSYGGGVCTLDKLEVEPGRPIPADLGIIATWGRPNGECSMVGLDSTADPGATRADSIVGEGSGMELVKGWLSGSLSIIASIVSSLRMEEVWMPRDEATIIVFAMGRASRLTAPRIRVLCFLGFQAAKAMFYKSRETGRGGV